MHLLAGIRQSVIAPDLKTKFETYVMDRISSETKLLFNINTPSTILDAWKSAGVDGVEFNVSTDSTEEQISYAKQFLPNILCRSLVFTNPNRYAK